MNNETFEFTGKTLGDYLDNEEPIVGRHYLSPRYEQPYKLIDKIPKGSKSILKMEFPDVTTIKESPLALHFGDRGVVINDLLANSEQPFLGMSIEQLAPFGVIIPPRTYF